MLWDPRMRRIIMKGRRRKRENKINKISIFFWESVDKIYKKEWQKITNFEVRMAWQIYRYECGLVKKSKFRRTKRKNKIERSNKENVNVTKLNEHLLVSNLVVARNKVQKVMMRKLEKRGKYLRWVRFFEMNSCVELKRERLIEKRCPLEFQAEWDVKR